MEKRRLHSEEKQLPRLQYHKQCTLNRRPERGKIAPQGPVIQANGPRTKRPPCQQLIPAVQTATGQTRWALPEERLLQASSGNMCFGSCTGLFLKRRHNMRLKEDKTDRFREIERSQR